MRQQKHHSRFLLHADSIRQIRSNQCPRWSVACQFWLSEIRKPCGSLVQSMAATAVHIWFWCDSSKEPPRFRLLSKSALLAVCSIDFVYIYIYPLTILHFCQAVNCLIWGVFFCRFPVAWTPPCNIQGVHAEKCTRKTGIYRSSEAFAAFVNRFWYSFNFFHLFCPLIVLRITGSPTSPKFHINDFKRVTWFYDVFPGFG